MLGDIYDSTPVSGYQPTKEVADLTGKVKRAFNDGYDILHRSFEELNNMSVIDRMNRDQRTFNSFVDESYEDPREAWKWRGTRSMARNRTMAMHAHLTSSYIVPNVFAQNDQDEGDLDMAEIGRDILEWMTVNSNYRDSFLLTSLGMLVNPVTYLGVDYCEVYQKIKIRTEQGWEKKEILDDVLSGFQANVYSADQILITNAYEQNIQKQRTVIKKKYVEYEEAEALFGEQDNWGYVQAGIQSIYNDEDGLFYEVKDDEHDHLVEIVYAESRREDMEVPFVNGIFMGNEEDIEMNPIKHRDSRGAPKYDIVPFGYERINEHFFYYKSLVNNVGWDHQLLDALYEVTMNKEILDLLPPVAVSGVDDISTDMMMPGAVSAFENPEAKVTAIMPRSNNASGYNAMAAVESSLKENSISDVQSGQLPDANQKAYSVAQAERNSQILLSGVGKTLGQSVAQVGQLMLDIGVNHLTTAQIDELTGNLGYRNFLLEDQTVDGKQVSKKIIFSEALVGKTMSEDQKKAKSLELLDKTGYPKNSEHIYMVNPHLFSKMKYMIRVEPDTMIPKNSAFEQAMDQEMYTLLRQDPIVQPEQLVRDLLRGRKKKADDYIVEQSATPEQVMGTVPETETAANAKSKAVQPRQPTVI